MNVTNGVLFVCGHNAGRSQMAQAFFNNGKRRYARVDGAFEAISAGTRHGSSINPLVVATMQEAGIDMRDATRYFPKGMDDPLVLSRARGIRRVIVACDDTFILPSAVPADVAPEYWRLSDPHGQPIEVIREVRDATRAKVYELLEELERDR